MIIFLFLIEKPASQDLIELFFLPNVICGHNKHNFLRCKLHFKCADTKGGRSFETLKQNFSKY